METTFFFFNNSGDFALFVSDLHYALKQFDWLTTQTDACDALVIGGDLLDLAGALELDVQMLVVEKYLQRLRQNTQVIVSSGNHDGDGRDASGESRARWIRAIKSQQLHVDGESVDLDGVRITVCPWWDGPVSKAEVEKLISDSQPPAGTSWVWINHAPPMGPLSWTGKKFAGDSAVSEWIERFQPDIVLSGHIHNAPFYADGAWAQKIGRTWAFNPGRQIGSSPATVRIDLSTRLASWHSMAGCEQVCLD